MAERKPATGKGAREQYKRRVVVLLETHVAPPGSDPAQARYDLEAEKDRLGSTLDGIRPLSAAS
jgi:hypothetical protein